MSAVFVLALLAVTALSFWAVIRKPSGNISPAASEDSFVSLALPEYAAAESLIEQTAGSSRTVYPFSVIPGGAESGAELQNAQRQDPVVAAHYADFRTVATHAVHLAAAREVYVSYRLGNRIYWTRKKITLHAGETLLTDGAHFARTRCGNRLSETPQTPTSPEEPTAEVLNHPLAPTFPEFTPTEAVADPVSPAFDPLVLALNSPNQPATPGYAPPFVPPIPFLPCCGGTSLHPIKQHSAPPPSGPVPPTPPSVPVAATPEPSSIALLVAGLIATFCLYAWRRS